MNGSWNMPWLYATGTTKIRQGTLAVWLVVLFWGFHYVVLYQPLRLINPERYLLVRFGWASGVVFLMCLFFPFWRGISRMDWGGLLLLSFVEIVGYNWTFLLAASILDPVPLVLILSLRPITVALYSHLKGHESFSLFQWGAMGLVCIGIFLVVDGGTPHTMVHLATPKRSTGLFLAFLSLILLTISTVLSRFLLTRVSTVQVTFLPILLGGIILLCLHPGWIVLPTADRTPIIIFSLLYSVFLALFLAYFLWNFAISSIGPTRASLWTSGQPLVTAAGAFLFLDHYLSWVQVTGGLLTLAGFWIFFGKEVLPRK